MHILIIEDDFDLGFALQQALKAEDNSSEWRRSIADAPRSAQDMEFDCVLLDLTLPNGVGFDLLNRWRKVGIATPIIVITARSALCWVVLAIYGYWHETNPMERDRLMRSHGSVLVAALEKVRTESEALTVIATYSDIFNHS